MVQTETNSGMIKAVIVEDEPLQVIYLQNLLSEFCPEVTVVDTVLSEDSFVQKISASRFDLLFLDVKLGVRNSFELLEQIAEIDFHIIVISGYEEFAFRAIRTGVIDYLMKPFTGKDLHTSVEKAAANIQLKRHVRHNSSLQTDRKDHSICISGHDSYTFVPCQSVTYLKSDGNYTRIHFMNEKNEPESILATKTLLHFEQKLCTHHFIRIHQSYLVNKSKIRKINKSNREMILVFVTK
ncbi:MAG: LytTR family DNA-binding domain-containing protein [Bacteroidota bacterium]